MPGTICNLFSTPIYKINILNLLNDALDIENVVREKFKNSLTSKSSLEKHGGVSTYELDNQLHKLAEFSKLNDIILFHSLIYWRVLDVDGRLSPRIDQCWSNLHVSGSFTLHHSHSLMPMVATFYLKAKKNSGDLILINPAEYSITNIPFSQSIEKKIETSLKVETGDLIIFPGYVRHKTGENLSGDDRIVISFNLGYEGKYLSSNSEYPSLHNDNTFDSEIEYLHNKILNLEFIIENLKRTMSDENKA
jgi:uncharacterized protein (TIGR02466 family)